jgi:prepilin-type N-terminal cleavage/methylation domain-containing protein
MATMHTRSRSGTTLLELLCSLALLGVLLGLAALPVSYAGDVLGARAARDAILNAAAASRALAIQHGGADLSLTAADGTMAISTRDGVVQDTLAQLASAFRVEIDFGDARAEAVTLRFDALGIGRLANRTVRIRRGSVTAGVTFSAYGRARAW